MRQLITSALILAFATLSACAPTPGQPPTPSPSPSTRASVAPVPAGPILVTTVAGIGTYGFTDGKQAQFYHPSSIAVTPENEILVLDRFNHSVRKIDTNGVTSTYWGEGEQGNKEGGNGVGRLNQPIQLLLLANGELMIADAQNHTIRKLTPGGELSTFAGSREGFLDGPLKEARFNWPSDLVTDGKGTFYVSDRNNHAIRKIAPDGTVSTLAGDGKPGYDEGKGKNARFNEPYGLTLGPDGNLYVADAKNHVIRKVTLAGEVTTYAGSGQAGSREDSRLKAEFREPRTVAFSPSGTMYICDRFNHRIRYLTADDQIKTLTGIGTPGFANGPVETAALSYPYDLAFDNQGNLLIADYVNHMIRRVNFKPLSKNDTSFLEELKPK